MLEGLWGILGLGFLLGIKHALEPDHVVAVSTIVGKNNSPLKSGFLGMFWGAGHTATLLIIFIILHFTQTTIPDTWEMYFEAGVGLMLVYLGITTFLPNKKPKKTGNKNTNQLFLKSIIIGQIHGLAGSAAMTLLVITTVDSLRSSLLYIGTFGLGTVLGMVFFTMILSIPFFFTNKGSQLNTLFITSTSLISIGYGIYYIYQIGFLQPLFI